MKGKTSDKDLVIAFQSGDKSALNQLVKQWHKTFCEKAYWLVKDADVAKDIAQDSWTVIIRRIDALNKPERFGSWALRIVCNNAIDWLNKNKRQQKHKEQIKHEQETVAIQKPFESSSEIKLKLLEVFKQLPQHQQVVVKLFYTESYSLKEISSMLNISVGTAKSRLFHAREKLKQLLKHYNYEK
ncbi:RNA polymerase subunit sigma-24 [Algibacter marinivivus]|uniref:RNA polymerase subunit sigma-24 n=1 Tax=Algibacter marinivivus TaxID=2100723 RepID=A0A2U2X4F2_9FLAO|nr:sigma-70 family RNA polymerase sigma factor [Algibacter marinivivus]PWH82657.1 RNA polymerase subunit sigma-24 [Algibacter marinivivus]